MALPAGALTATITVGAPIDIAGAAGTLVSLHVRPDLPGDTPLVWAANGAPIQPWSASPAAGEAPVTSASLEVLADQPGVLTSSTVDGAARMVEIQSWPLIATWVTRQSETGAATRHVRHFNAPAPGAVVDLDLLPADGVTVPATIIYAQTYALGSSEIAAEASATAAAASESAAAASALAASGSASSASGSADTATTKAGEASASASAAAGAASSASSSAAAATAAASDAETARDAAVVARTAAETAAGTSAARAGEASGSASTATTQAGIATTKAEEASASAASAAATLASAVTKTTIDAKGDLLVGAANGTLARLAVGVNGAALVADSTQSGGMRWAMLAPLPNVVREGLIAWIEPRNTNAATATRDTIPDLSGNGNTATLTGFAYTAASGYVGNRLALAGTETLTVPIASYLEAADEYTLEWIGDMSTGFGAYAALIGSSTGVARYVGMRTATNTIGFVNATALWTAADLEPPASPSMYSAELGTHHITVTASTAEWKFYYAGAPVRTVAFAKAANWGNITLAAANLAYAQTGPRGFRAYSRVLTADEVAHNYVIERERYYRYAL